MEAVKRRKLELEKRTSSQNIGSSDKNSDGNRPTEPGAAQRRIAELRERTAKRFNSFSPSSAPSQHTEGDVAKGGLRVGIHPALLKDDIYSSNGRFKEPSASNKPVRDSPDALSQERPTESKRNPLIEDIEVPKVENLPYYDPRTKESRRTRAPRVLSLNASGKYIEEAEQFRRQSQLEKLKKRVALHSEKAGLNDELLIASKSIHRVEPPTVEWWDLPYVADGSTYGDQSSWKIFENSEAITSNIQHPIPVLPPYLKNQPSSKSLFLTKKEQKKIRRQTRAEARKEKQDRQLLGLEPPEPPKVKLSNLMRVLGDAAIKDPTKMEAEVRRQVEERRLRHEQMNEERKLTPEERRDRTLKKLEEDAASGLQCLVFKIKYLAHRPHRLKIDLNAKQLGLTGACILSDKFNLVIVEGGRKNIKHFKKLMINRIDWTDTSRNSILAQGNKLADMNGSSIPYNENKCDLVWEGDLSKRNFSYWTFRKCPTENEARQSLEQLGNAEHFWVLANSWNRGEDFS
ncbi:U4/U6 X U5 tri-snRNP complex subunit Prp3 [Schizosaccharomyces cryophilus OY26]|uniref:U4/U6 X U5 tri-snRNP complex subunit Prp3 n=1 Tax=Schizosaccharomyces cryophilus (strain OY26 / ATCC MYA-4695 / CBS 11777 / NBRC 106824 / NRRL Y48691) TaxID=653667 RepID=S9W0J3_SCHCR|nr:U4/U6 X U5 tri-snRNP complex subunit Prp3 [Schizosaccharomyces cryophilus OY26]EPY51934.1 U4/U6 X U5 tri-snRNP complex subunit Prp3 [Schizosaccharomyces cryophilus OY26]